MFIEIVYDNWWIYESEETKMKKLLGLSALAAVFVLSACGGSSSDDTVCELDMMGLDAVFTATVEDDQVTHVALKIDVSDLDEEEAEIMEQMIPGVSLEGDYLVHDEDEDMALEDFIEEMEDMGATCD